VKITRFEKNPLDVNAHKIVKLGLQNQNFKMLLRNSSLSFNLSRLCQGQDTQEFELVIDPKDTHKNTLFKQSVAHFIKNRKESDFENDLLKLYSLVKEINT
jgi:hypothetical protein